MSKDMTLGELKARVEEARKAHRERQKACYQLAKRLGFTTREAMVLQNQSLETIERLADEREKADAG